MLGPIVSAVRGHAGLLDAPAGVEGRQWRAMGILLLHRGNYAVGP